VILRIAPERTKISSTRWPISLAGTPIAMAPVMALPTLVPPMMSTGMPRSTIAL